MRVKESMCVFVCVCERERMLSTLMSVLLHTSWVCVCVCVSLCVCEREMEGDGEMRMSTFVPVCTGFMRVKESMCV